VDPISQINPVLDALRRQLAENIERMRKAGKLAAAGQGAAARQSAPAGAEPLEAAVRRRVGAIDRHSAEGLAAASRVFVETVLVAEFGQGLLADPGLGEMLNDLSASLREDPELREQLDRMLTEL
jgi:hypothetical protein